MKWVAVFLLIVVAAVACGDVVDGEDTKAADLETRIVAIEDELRMNAPYHPALGKKTRIDALEDRVWQLEMGWR